MVKITDGDFVQLGMFEGNSGSVLLLGFSWGVREMSGNWFLGYNRIQLGLVEMDSLVLEVKLQIIAFIKKNKFFTVFAGFGLSPSIGISQFRCKTSSLFTHNHQINGLWVST